mgnify:CR=1 FL=1
MRVRLRNAVIPLLSANILMFILQAILGSRFTESLMLVSSDVTFRPWILFTSMFLHGSFSHLFFNMYVLFIFGSLIEQRIGTKRFLILYFISGIIASFSATFFYRAALGASGALMGVIGVVIMLMPDLKVLLFFFIPMSMRTAGIIIAILDLFGIFPGVAHIAHLAGLACGLAYGYYLLKKRRQFTRHFVVQPRRASGPYDYESTITLDEKDIEEYLRNGRL